MFLSVFENVYVILFMRWLQRKEFQILMQFIGFSVSAVPLLVNDTEFTPSITSCDGYTEVLFD